MEWIRLQHMLFTQGPSAVVWFVSILLYFYLYHVAKVALHIRYIFLVVLFEGLYFWAHSMVQ